MSTYGRLDCAYNNAGIEGFMAGRLHEYPEDQWDRLIDVNVKGVWLCLKHEIPQMMQQGGGQSSTRLQRRASLVLDGFRPTSPVSMQWSASRKRLPSNMPGTASE